MKEYPLTLNTLGDLDNGETCGIYTKGHHDFDAFRAALAQEFGEHYQGYVPRHSFRRWEFYPGHEDGSYKTALNDAPPGQRGVFPVTSVEWY